MSDEASVQPRDASAWPRGATPFSLVIGLVSLLIGLAQVEGETSPLIALVTGVLMGAATIVVAIRRWLAGGQVPFALALLSGGTAVVAIVIIVVTDDPVGPALLSGLIAGLMFANIWAIRAAARHGESRASRS